MITRIAASVAIADTDTKVKMNDVKKLLAQVERLGCSVTKAKRRGHYRIDTGQGPVFVAASASDHRAMLNIRRDLRARGVEV